MRHACFLIFLSCPFYNVSIWPKQPLFLPILHVFAPLNDVRAYICCVHCLVQKNNPNYVIFFFRGWYPTSNTSAPPPRGENRDTAAIFWFLINSAANVLEFTHLIIDSCEVSTKVKQSDNSIEDFVHGYSLPWELEAISNSAPNMFTPCYSYVL